MRGKRGLQRINLIIILAAVVLIVTLLLLYFTFFYVKTAKTKEEFNQALYNCNRINFINDEDAATWIYSIQGVKGDSCLVDVELKIAKKGISDIKILEGKSMLCEIPLRVVVAPESNLKNCHGLLKEEMQSLIIEKMHAYVTANLEEIGKVVGS